MNESLTYNPVDIIFLLPASTLRRVKNLLVNIKGKMKGGISKLKDTCKLLVGIIGVNFFGYKESCEEK